MRQVKIFRPKRMEACANSLIVELDGQKQKEKLKNGTEMLLQVDEHAHELHLHGGMLAGKAFDEKLSVPAGSSSYAFQVDMMTVNNSNYKPVLRPCGSERLKDHSRTITLMGWTLTHFLLDEKLRGILKQAPEARLHIVLEAAQWGVLLYIGENRQVVLKQPYSHHKGGLMAATMNAVEAVHTRDEAARAETLETLFTDYLAYLPDYRRIGTNELQFLG